ADGGLQHGGAKALHHAPAIAVGPSYFAHERAESGSVARGILRGDMGLVLGATDRTPPLMQHEVPYLQLGGRQQMILVFIERFGRGKGGFPTWHPPGHESVSSGRWQQPLPMAWVARFPTGFARGGGIHALARLLIGRVRRRRSGGGRGILREPSF